MNKWLINTDFAKLWLHSISNILSNRFRELILPIIVLGLSGSPLLTSFVLLSQRISSILFSIPLGTWVEKRNLVLISTICNLIYAMLLFLLACLITIEDSSLGIIGIILFLMGFVELMLRITLAAMVPKIVSRDRLLSANNLLEAADAIVTFIGPALGGVILATYGPSITLVICGILILFCMIIISLVKYRNENINQKVIMNRKEKLKNFINEAREGVDYLYANDSQIVSTISAVVLGFTTVFIELTIIIHAKTALHFTETSIGILLSCAGIGNIIGVLIMPRFKRINWLYLLSSPLMISSLGILLLTSHQFIIMCIGMVIFDGALSMAFVVQITVQQGITPDQLIARVRSAIIVLSGVATIMGTLLSGLISEWDSNLALILGFIVLLLCGIFILKYKQQGVTMNKIQPIYHRVKE
ncbi:MULTISPECIES: MFS transporter [unclassified Oceanobacillus]|uniref:MFS transporter n=1 Tax=unclassified Oceanobacillus TaxID=2630292 RepID=UPI001BE6E69F|nr:MULTISPECIES: MFS transporter [unclassified Oceanobacillus]MBT2598987.1 MFS transporter [Oceanobacillus sp. ISL-74]MBT2651906.1 MFS transporter [Oceanobacillus sp. ISL-73]